MDLQTLWLLIIPQAKVLFCNNGESSYQFYVSKLTSHDSSIWQLFLSAGILFEHYLTNEEWKRLLFRDYCSFLCKDFTKAPFSLELIELHYFLTKQILGNEHIPSDLYLSFFTPPVDLILNSQEYPSNLFHWFSRVLAGAESNPGVAAFLTTSELNILVAFTNRIQSTPSELKSDVTKLLIMPYIDLIVSTNALNSSILQEIWTNLCLEFQKSGDLHVASIIGCSVVDHLNDSPDFGILLHGIWNLIFELLDNSTHLVLRKRGAHMMQLYAIYLMKSNQEPKTSNWCQSYLEVYRQLEGCNTIHLVSQVRSTHHHLILFVVDSIYFRFGVN
jgi:hypothetical protein